MNIITPYENRSEPACRADYRGNKKNELFIKSEQKANVTLSGETGRIALRVWIEAVLRVENEKFLFVFC